MINMLRLTIISCLFSIPVPLVMGGGKLSTTIVMLFVALSIVVPLFLRNLKTFQEKYVLRFNTVSLLYSGLFWAAFFITGAGTLFNFYIDPTQTVMIAFITLLSFVVFQGLIIFSAYWLYTWFNREKKRPIVDAWLDMALIIVPIPTAIFSNFLYGFLSMPEVSDNGMAAGFVLLIGFIGMIGMGLLVLAMGTFAIYLFPSITMEYRGVRIGRILVTAVIWLVWNMVTSFSLVFFDLVPASLIAGTTMGANLVRIAILYTIPTINQVLNIGVSTALGFYFERVICNLLDKRKAFKVKANSSDDELWNHSINMTEPSDEKSIGKGLKKVKVNEQKELSNTGVKDQVAQNNEVGALESKSMKKK